MGMDVVDYEIKGAEMQFVEIELDPTEAAIGIYKYDNDNKPQPSRSEVGKL